MKFFFQSQLTLFAAFSVICFEIAVPIFAMPLTAVSAAEMLFVLFFFHFRSRDLFCLGFDLTIYKI